jgi:hypothetical protein
MGDRGEDELDVLAVDAGEVAAEVDGLSVYPPPAGVVSLLNPRLSLAGEPAVEGADEEFDAGLEWIQALRPAAECFVDFLHRFALLAQPLRSR